MNLLRFNHWWRDGQVDSIFLGKPRKVLREILPYLDKRQIIVLKGLRRVGKTTLFYQLTNYLLRKKNISPYRILYFSFDEMTEEPDEILQFYAKEILKEDLMKTKCYLFFDEIQKLKNWPNKIKIIYDLYPNLKIFISGSASLGLIKGAKESLAGRSFEFEIHPLDFPEYIKFRKVAYEEKRIDIFKDTLMREFDLYLNNSGFIEMVNEENPEIIRRYFKESIIERVIYRDIPEHFTINNTSLLYRILNIIASQPGMLVEYKNIGNDLKRDQRTIAQYFEYLRWCLLLKSLYRFSPNFLTSEKKLKKYYLTYPALTLALAGQPSPGTKGKVIENLLVSLTDGDFFYRSASKEEVDIILEPQKISMDLKVEGPGIPLEIKYSNKIYPKDLRGVRSFMKKYGVKQGYIISEDFEEELNFDWGRISIIPAWKFLLKMEYKI
ncbi:MAG: ATP-binding protein [Candidatus Aminicenantia bacterium]